eukprot:TRINITY_DN96155_c0_g1_i1.p1 TRINITY_DN96155_c0_g1~~TRINITY_DN96155_c0_g1_i1.p1  ORF type:complete len:233 (+),score=28.43 TRINITY_DN96155_c0_g1_i1:35-733(+)
MKIKILVECDGGTYGFEVVPEAVSLRHLLLEAVLDLAHQAQSSSSASLRPLGEHSLDDTLRRLRSAGSFAMQSECRASRHAHALLPLDASRMMTMLRAPAEDLQATISDSDPDDMSEMSDTGSESESKSDLPKQLPIPAPPPRGCGRGRGRGGRPVIAARFCTSPPELAAPRVDAKRPSITSAATDNFLSSPTSPCSTVSASSASWRRSRLGAQGASLHMAGCSSQEGAVDP